jgi:hypothetical protein
MNKTRRAMLLALTLLAFSPIVQAQDMALRFWISPKTGTGTTFLDPLRPAYVRELPAPRVLYSSISYGFEPTVLVGAQLTAEQVTSLTSHADVVMAPVAGLDDAITASMLAPVQSYLESMKIPANDITAAWTWRKVIRRVGAIFQFMQEYDAQQRKTFFEGNINLDTRLNTLTGAQETALFNAASVFSIPSNFANNALIRTVLIAYEHGMPEFQMEGQLFPAN